MWEWSVDRRDLGGGLGLLLGPTNVGVLEREGRLLLLGSAPPEVLTDAGVVPESIDAVLLTHGWELACLGARELAAGGVAVWAPESERALIEEPQRHWEDDRRRLEVFERFHPAWQAPREGVALARVLHDGEDLEWRGLRIRCVRIEGPTDGGLAYLVAGAAFVGGLMHSDGRLPEVHSLQGGGSFPWGGGWGEYHGYCDRAPMVLDSLERILELGPQVLVPTRGLPADDPRGAVDRLRERLAAFLAEYHATSALRWYFAGGRPEWPADRSALERRVRPLPEWVREVGGTSRAVVAPSGEALLLDCYGDVPERIAAPDGTLRLEALWVTHFHFDHTARVNAMRARSSCEVIVHETMAEILARPDAWLLPCLDPAPIAADRVTMDRESWEWRGFRLTAMGFPGQTYYDAALLVEREGVRVLFVGDSLTPGGLDDYCAGSRNLLGEGRGFLHCLEILDRLGDDVLLVNQHVEGAFAFTPAEREELRASLRRRREAALALLPFGDPDDGLDPGRVRLDPYFQRAAPGAVVEWQLHALSWSRPTEPVLARLSLPDGWEPLQEWIRAEPASDGPCATMRARAPEDPNPGRAAIGVAVGIGGDLDPDAARALVDWV